MKHRHMGMESCMAVFLRLNEFFDKGEKITQMWKKCRFIVNLLMIL